MAISRDTQPILRRTLLRTALLLTGTAVGASLAQACAAPAEAPAPTTAAPVPTRAATTSGAAPATSAPATAAPAAVAPAAATTATGGSIKVGIRNWDYDTLDPHKTAFTQVYYMIMNVVDPLVWLAPDLTYQPGLAASWESSPDTTSWTFKLRQDVKFHDGTPFNAEAVKFNLDRMVDPKTQSKQAGILLGPYDRSDVVDSNTIKISFKQPNAVLLNALSQHFCGMVSPAAVQQWGDNFNQHLSGTGPFTFKSENPKVEVQLERNPDYKWGPSFMKHQGPANAAAITFRFIQENETRMTTLETGETNLIDEVPVEQVPRLQSDSRFKLFSVPKLGIARGYHLNTELPPTDDIRVRKALEYAVDRDALNKAIFKDVYPMARSVLVKGTQFYDTSLDDMYPHDIAKAKQLLDEAGWIAGADGMRRKEGQPLHVFLALFPGFVAEAPSELIQAQLKDIGVELEIKVLTGSAMMDGLAAKGSTINASLIGSYDVDPGNLLYRFYHSSNAGRTQYSHFTDPQLDKLLTDGLSVADPTQRTRIYTQVQKIIMDQALTVPLYANVSLFAGRAALKDLTFDARANPLLYDVSVEGR